MCSGKTHTVINLAAIACVTPALLYLETFDTRAVVTGAAAALFGTLFLSPDLDLKHSRSNRAWGWFGWLWYGYHRCFSHRQSSHLILFGTATRLVYLAAVALAMTTAFYLFLCLMDGLALPGFLKAQSQIGDHIRELTIWISDNSDFSLAVVLGVTLSDSLHILADRIYSRGLRLLMRSRRECRRT